MWNRRENENGGTESQPVNLDMPPRRSREYGTSPPVRHPDMMASIGQSICIRGELTGEEDLTLDGKVKGKIDLREHSLTIGPNGQIQAEVNAKTVVVQGEITGNITATDKVEVASTGRVLGDIAAPRIVIADGAHIKGTVNMAGGQEDAARSSSVSRAKSSTVSTALMVEGPAGGAPKVARVQGQNEGVRNT